RVRLDGHAGQMSVEGACLGTFLMARPNSWEPDQAVVQPGRSCSAPAPSYSLLTVTTKTSERNELGRSAASDPIVLETKLMRPPVRAEYVARSEVVELLRAGTARALTVVTAPPGFGKTTLLAAWSAAEARRAAWLSL